ncbi:MAG: hypothetical protein ACYS30_11885 [Planctomycetota bacterium]
MQVRPIIEARTFSYQQIHAHKPLFGKKGKLLNFGHLDFDIVSDLELRISDFASLGIFTLVKRPLQIAPFMQNKPNFLESQMNVTVDITVDYENKHNWTLGENKPNQTQFQTGQGEFKINA